MKAQIIILMFFCLALFCECGKVCKKSDNDPCYCDLKNGSGVLNLATYARRKEDSNGPFAFAAAGWMDDYGADFMYNPCIPVTSQFGLINKTVSGLAIVRMNEPVDDHIYDVGQQDNVVYQRTFDKQLEIVYMSKNKKYRSIVKLNCQPTLEYTYLINLEPVGYDNDTFLFSWEGYGSCLEPGPHIPHSEFKSYVVITTVCGIVGLYVAIGITYKLCKVRSRVPRPTSEESSSTEAERTEPSKCIPINKGDLLHDDHQACANSPSSYGSFDNTAAVVTDQQ